MPDQPGALPERQRGDVVRVGCGEMVHGGLCLSQFEDGVTVFVAGGIPGEQVDVRLDYRKRKNWFATVVGSPQPSEHRVTPPCKFVPDCGGCQMQHIAYPHQLALKQGIVEDAMRRQGVVIPALVAHGLDDPWRYRWRGEFHVIHGNDEDEPRLGFNRARSWTPIPIDECLIHHPAINAQLPLLRHIAGSAADKSLTALHLTVGEGGDELMIRAKPENAMNHELLDAIAVENGTRWSTQTTSLQWRGMTFRVAPESFIQTNWANIETLYGLALDAIGDPKDQFIVDAYGGIGVLAVALAEEGAHVTCIENNGAAVRMALLNAEINNVAGRVVCIEEDVERAIADVGREGHIDVVILDPPRAGCATEVTSWLALAGPPRVIYVSCDPATMARDLRVLVRSGPYTIDEFHIVDMFPQTYHVESVAVLTRG